MDLIAGQDNVEKRKYFLYWSSNSDPSAVQYPIAIPTAQ
jgi:hypothetical protein